MLKNFLLASLLLANTFLTAQTPASTSSIFFETAQSELSAEARQTLDEIAPALLQAPDYQVNIEAFTDDRGAEQYNLRLAADRAASVQNYLAAKGLGCRQNLRAKLGRTESHEPYRSRATKKPPG